jgi:hypothetical protein
MIITNSNQLHDHLYYIKFWLVFSRFLISSWREKGHEPSRAVLKSFSSSSGLSQLGSNSLLQFNYNSIVRQIYFSFKKKSEKCVWYIQCMSTGWAQWNLSCFEFKFDDTKLSFSKLRQPTGQRLCNARKQQKKFQLGQYYS